ncbi:MAG: hypothetical protein JSS81_05960 [Acidobacteria bacterium]|nr:hypothetical protein [Acidobacteriota bacterium]
MSTSPIRKFDEDVEAVRRQLELTNAVLTVLHGGLSEVLRCDVSRSGAIEMKAIAETSLCEVQRIALQTQEVANV